MTGQQIFEHRFPDDTWADQSPAIQRAFDTAARERANPALCANCGRNADYHSGALNTGCRFTPAMAAVKAELAKEEA